MNTPTEADKRAAKRILGTYAEYDLEGVAKTGRIIAEEMAAEREALRLAKEAIIKLRRLLMEHHSYSVMRPEKVVCDVCLDSTDYDHADQAITAIEKVMP